MGAIEEYKTRNAERDARRAEKQKPPQERRWWFSQPIPIDRFTGWLVAWPAWVYKIPLVFIGCIAYSASDLRDIHQTGFMLDFATGRGTSGAPTDATFDVAGNQPREYDVSGISLIQGGYGAFGN